MDMFPVLDMVSGIVAAAAPGNHVHLLHNAGFSSLLVVLPDVEALVETSV
jgi:hypothetical protein